MFVDVNSNEYDRFHGSYVYEYKIRNRIARFNDCLYSIDKIVGFDDDQYIKLSFMEDASPIVDNIIKFDQDGNRRFELTLRERIEHPIDYSPNISIRDIPINEDPSLPLRIIFLDIDHVLIGDRFTEHFSKRRRDILIDIFGIKDRYSDMEYSIAHTHMMDKHAILRLEQLLFHMNKISRIRIVISSEWRKNGSPDEMFKYQPFGKFIIGSIPIDDTHRGDQILTWLDQHDDIDSYVVIDDDLRGLTNVIDKVVHVRNLLSLIDIINAAKILS